MKNSWTKSDLRILKKRYAERGAKYVAKKTGHPFTSVVAKANSLGIHSNSLRRWNQFEVNYLLKNYSVKPVDSIARSLKRTPLSVNNKARQLKIFVPKPLKWTEEELNQLRKLWTDKAYSIDEVAAKLNKTRAAAHYKAWKMGLRRPQVWRFWTKEETRYLKKTYKKKSYKEIAKDLGMSRIAVFQKWD
jgi:biotin operon repressor